MFVSRVMANGGDRFGSQILVNGVSSLVPQVSVNGVVANDVDESVGHGMVNVVIPNGVSGSTAEGMGSGMMANGFSESVIYVGIDGNGVSEPIPRDMVNGVRANSVSESVHQGTCDGIMANGVRDAVRQGMVNGVRNNGVSKANRESVSEVVVDGSSSSFRQAASEYVDQLDKERLLHCFNQEVVEDIGWLREYHSIARGLKVDVRRRRERIRQLQLLRNCQELLLLLGFGNECKLKMLRRDVCFRVIANIAYSMEALPRCDELRRSSCSEEWEDMFVLYCRRAIIEDSNLAREIDGLFAGLTARIEKREYFIDELDILADRSMCEDYRLASEINRVAAEVNSVTMQRERFLEELDSLATRHVLVREMELNASKKNLFIEKLQGTVPF
nr:hypothetical protein [Tanacetum cinerariifolium]